MKRNKKISKLVLMKASERRILCILKFGNVAKENGMLPSKAGNSSRLSWSLLGRPIISWTRDFLYRIRYKQDHYEINEGRFL